MKKFRLFSIAVVILIFCIFTVLPASALGTNVWVMCEIHQIQTGQFNGKEDTRLLLSAIDQSFTNTWLIVSSEAAKLVAATALTAYSLDRNVNVYIVPYGTTGFRVERIRVLSQ